MLIDVHAHLNDERLENQIEDVLKRAKENKVEKIICVGYNLQSSKKAIELAEKFDEVYASIGIHPNELQDFNENAEKFLIDNSAHKKVVSIGEIGLDYHYLPCDKELQKKVFVRQLEIAYQCKLPIQIHSRDASQDTVEILKQHKNLLAYGGLVHCFSGSVEMLNEIEKLGLKISMGGVLTYKNARQTVDVIKALPLSMLTLETDCPYLSPVPFRSELNEPKNVKYVAQKVAEIRNIYLEEISKIASANTLELFKKLK